MALVASLYHLPPRVLPSIQAVEGGRPGVLHHNTDGTLDVGVMQINTRWLAPLARYTGTPATEVFLRLRDQPCYNIAASGAIMRTYLEETHGNLLLAVGDYHSHTIELNLAYRRQVLASARMLFMRPPAGVARRRLAERASSGPRG